MNKHYHNRTKLVHGGTRRSQYGEVSEAKFIRQGYIYKTAENAETLFLESRDDDFIYPGLPSSEQHSLANEIISGYGTLITFEFVKGKTAAFKYLNNLKIIIISNNFGDAKSIATHPAITTHQRLTEKQKEDLQISEGLIRLSVGLEDTDDLINDVSSALRTL